MRLVLDTSAAANIVLGTAEGLRLATVLDQADWVIAPSLFHSEMGNTLWKSVRFGSLAQDTALALYEDAVALVDEFVADQSLIIQSIAAAVRHQHPVYDMIFVTLAQRYGCRLLTTDQRLQALTQRIDPGLCWIDPSSR